MGVTDWEEKYRDGDMPWDHGEASPALGELLEKLPRELWGEGEVLVPGCGLGHDVAALRAVGLPAIGLDLAPSAIRLAIRDRGLGPEHFMTGDLLDGRWRAGRRFAAIWEHTCLCSMPRESRPGYVEAMAELLAPGNCLLGVFYTDPEPRDDGMPGPPFGCPAEDLQELFAEEFDMLHGWVPERGYESRLGREWLAVFRRK